MANRIGLTGTIVLVLTWLMFLVFRLNQWLWAVLCIAAFVSIILTVVAGVRGNRWWFVGTCGGMLCLIALLAAISG